MTPREARRSVGVPIIRAAVWSGVSEPTARLYEANPDAVRDPIRRARLDAVYAQFAQGISEVK